MKAEADSEQNANVPVRSNAKNNGDTVLTGHVYPVSTAPVGQACAKQGTSADP